MLICIDAGNSQIHTGFYFGDKLVGQFRLNTKNGWNADTLGKELKSFITSQGISKERSEGVIVASVVPSLNAEIKKMCQKHFNCEPLYVNTQINTGLKFNYNNPHEIGADLICETVAASELYPGKNLFIIDMGTATTIIAVTKNKEFETGVILPGLATQVNSLSSVAELLSKINFEKPKSVIATNTVEAIKSGIYYGHLGALERLVKEMGKKLFGQSKYTIVATGGLSRFYIDEELFHNTVDDLVLRGMKIIYNRNK